MNQLSEIQVIQVARIAGALSRGEAEPKSMEQLSRLGSELSAAGDSRAQLVGRAALDLKAMNDDLWSQAGRLAGVPDHELPTPQTPFKEKPGKVNVMFDGLSSEEQRRLRSEHPEGGVVEVAPEAWAEVPPTEGYAPPVEPEEPEAMALDPESEPPQEVPGRKPFSFERAENLPEGEELERPVPEPAFGRRGHEGRPDGQVV